MSNVLLIIIVLDTFNRQSWVLIGKTTFVACDKLKVTRFPRQIVLSNDELAEVLCATVVTLDSFKISRVRQRCRHVAPFGLEISWGIIGR
jgi:hypothetical protein